MLWKILPDEVREDIKKQKDLKGNIDLQLAYLYGEMGDTMDEKLSRWNLAKLQQQLKYKTKNTTGLNAVASSAADSPQAIPASPPPPIPDLAAFTANMERLLNAAVTRGRNESQSRGRPNDRTPPASRNGSSGSQRTGRRSPNPRFKGCWCCGKEGHSRADCPEFKAIKKANDGKIPRDYAGAYEKSMKKSKVLAPISVRSQEPPPQPKEHDETSINLWPLLSSHKTVKPRPIVAPIVRVSNKFKAFESEVDDDDDEESIVRSLSAMTSKVQLASDKAKPQKARKKRSKPLDLAHLNLIAQKIKSGEITLPDMDLDEDDDYEYVWALVDSGAGANVAKREHFPNFKSAQAPKISLTIANGATMDNNGAGEVVSYSQDGTESKRIFYEAPVDMPILAVAELAQEGELGSEVLFRSRDGCLIDNLTGRKVHFVKRKGVYFMRLYFRKGINSGFTRQE